MNSVVLIGRLGKDPELRYTQNQTPVCTFSLATSHKMKGKESTQWHNIVAWQKLAEICSKHLGKGSQVAVTGRLEYRAWENKQGQKQVSAEIIAENIEFLGSPQQRSQREDAFGAHDMPNSDDLDNVPF